MQEIYKKLRPKTLDQVIGQDKIVKVLQGYFKSNKTPHSLLISGASGCGKTTIARIISTHVECMSQNFYEINAAVDRGIEKVRDIKNKINLKPIAGKSKVWLLDEAHKLSSDAQNGLLKIMEDTPSWVYFILASTDPKKLISTLLNRCTQLHLNSLTDKDMEKVLNNAITQEKAKVSEEVIQRIIQQSAGSARRALVILDQIIQIEDEQEQLEAIDRSESDALGIDLARALLNPYIKWPEVASILKKITEEAEDVRRLVLAFARTTLLSGGKMSSRAYEIICAFHDPMDTAKAGHAILAACCWEVFQRK